MRFLSFLMVVLFAVASAKGATLSGAVRDSEGAIISNAHLIVHFDPSGSKRLNGTTAIKEDLISATDSGGRFSLELSPGFYDVFVTAPGFSPYCTKIRLETKDVTHDVKLVASPIIVNRLGDRF
jgi:hypothetical protein